jgi:hypothetical protein
MEYIEMLLELGLATYAYSTTPALGSARLCATALYAPAGGVIAPGKLWLEHPASAKIDAESATAAPQLQFMSCVLSSTIQICEPVEDGSLKA